MRLTPLFLGALLITTGLAALPSAQAWPPVCLGPEVDEDVGPVHIKSYGILTCGVEVSIDTSGPCKDGIHHVYPATVHTSADCHTRVDLKWYDCVWNCGWNTIIDTPLLTVRHYTEQDGAQDSGRPGVPFDPCPITSAPPGSLQGVIHVEQDKNPCFDTRVTLLGAFVCTEPLAGSTNLTLSGRVAIYVPGCALP